MELNLDQNLSNKINTFYKSEKKPIDLKNYTDFEWDNYMLIGQYQIPEKIGEKYGLDFSNISDYTTSNDSKSLLVFIKNKKAVTICEINLDVKLNKNGLIK